MSMKYSPILLSVIFIIISSLGGIAQNKKMNKDGYQFSVDRLIPCTPVKNQQNTGTCWSFSAISFLESEMIRNGKAPVDLSDMFSVWHTYMAKAEKYIRYHGSTRLDEGSLGHDVLNVLKEKGMMTEEAYDGLKSGKTNYDHSGLVEELTSYLDGVLHKKPIDLNWRRGAASILDNYLEPLPETFLFNGEHYSPLTFSSQVVDLIPETYISLTSFLHHPFHEKFTLEIPDNFSDGQFYNVPLESFVAVAKHALRQGFSIEWDGDVSEEGFSAKQGIAIFPEKDWQNMTEKEKELTFKAPQKEKKVTAEMRQLAFDSQIFTDDHLMHLVGLAKDQNGVDYFIVKNSWGADSMGFEPGYVFMSESYFKRNTISIMVHKDAIPPMLRKNLRI